MTANRLVPARAVLNRAREENPAFAEAWDRTALARVVANALIGYRIAHNMTQAQLGVVLGMKQPRIARLEDGEHTPNLETLWRLSRVLGLTFTLSIQPYTDLPVVSSPPGSYVERFGSPSSGIQGFALARAMEAKQRGDLE
ncbi:MAG TPA: helix-turn-helix transcriptional regulator [Chloroflexota bacterium]|nr:helix-turn-helix transcriptional regulator [Chloroflexota bacterium]